MNSKNSERLMCPKYGIKSVGSWQLAVGRKWRALEWCGAQARLSSGEGLGVRRYGTIVCLLFIIVLFSPSSFSQTLSLQNVLDTIEKHNPLLASYQYKINADRSMAKGAKAWMPPMVGVGPYSIPYSIAPDETFFNRTEGSIIYVVEQEIPNPAKQKAKQNYLLSLAAVDSAEIGSSKNKLYTGAKIAYIDRFIAEKRLRIINEEIALLDFMIQTETGVYAVNQSDLTSIYKSQARKHTMEAMQAHERSAIVEANAKLNYLMNRPQSTHFAIDTILPFHNYSLADLDTSAAFVALHRSDILRIDRSISSMQFNRALSLSARKPDFNVRFEHYDMFGSRNTFSVMGSITIPIAPWASKSYKSEALSIQQQIEAMNYEKQNTINEARAMIQQTLLHTIAEYEEVNHYEKEVIPAYRKALQISLLSYKENTNGLLPSLMAWDDLIMTETEYIYHLEQAYKSEIDYENAIEKK